MSVKPQYSSLLIIALVQSTILLAAWVFYIVVRIKNPLHLPDGAALWVHRNATETTIIVTMTATVVHFITLTCFTVAVKHALRQRVFQRPISLVKLSLGVAALRASFIFHRRYLWLTLGVSIIFVAFALVNSAWTTFLNPVQVMLPVRMTGMELDLSSPDFDALLSQGINAEIADWTLKIKRAIYEAPLASASLDSIAFMGGATTATTNASGQAGLFNFNSVQYNVSTGGILPAINGYNGPPANNATSPPSGPGAAMIFASGPVPLNLTSSYDITGISSTHSVNQQGFTADVSCVDYTPGGWFPINVTTVPVNVTFNAGPVSINIPSSARTSLLGITCEPGIASSYSSTAQLFYSNGDSVMTLFCPNIIDTQYIYPMNNITIIHQGTGLYEFLPQTACTIRPLVTRSSVAYANQLVSSTPLNSTAVSYQLYLMFWVAYFISTQTTSFQTDMQNSLGNLLLSLMNPSSSTSLQAETSQAQVSLQEFWRGMVELGGTALRSGFTAYAAQNQSLTSSSDMWVPLEGWQNVTTMGWSFDDPTHIYALFPITLTAVLTYAAIFYALKPAHGYDKLEEQRDSNVEAETLGEDHHEEGHFFIPPSAMATFDASDLLHVVVASASGKLDHGPKAVREGDYWRQYEESMVSFRPGPGEVADQEDC